MSFKHKLARRLAMLRDSAALLALGGATIMVACSDDSSRATAPATAATAVAPSPPAFFVEHFADTRLSSRGWYDLPSGGISSITTAQHAPGSASALEVRFAQGATTPSPKTAARHLFPATDAVHLSYWVKYSTNWAGSGSAAGPSEFRILTTDDDMWVGPASTFLTTLVEHNYQSSGGVAVISTQDAKNIDAQRIGQDLTAVTEQRAVSGCNGNADGTPTSCALSGGAYTNGKSWKSAQPVFTAASGAGYKGNWHHVDVYLKMNSVVAGKGQLDGIAQYLIDGQLVIDKRNVLFRTGVHASMKFNQFLMAPYMNGGSPVAQTMWIDDLAVAADPPVGGQTVATVASVTVTPATASIVAGQTTQLTAVALDSAGGTLANKAMTWLSRDTLVAKVSTAGLVTALAVGSTSIIATSDARSDTVPVTVTAPPVATVTVSPTSATLTSAGATQQLAATARDASGATVAGQTIAWTSPNTGVATVSATGLVSAVANGTATITATAGGKSGTVAVTVSISTSTGTATLLFEEKFEDTGFSARGWYDLPSGGITSISSAEHISGSAHSLQVHFLPGGTSSSPKTAARHLFTPSTSVYVRYWTKFSSNWIGSGQTYQPHEFHVLTTEDDQWTGLAGTHLTTYIEHNYTSSGGVAVFQTQDALNIDDSRINQDLTNVTENRGVSGCNGNPDGGSVTCYTDAGTYYNGKTWKSAGPVYLPSSSSGAAYKGNWHQVEVYMQLNTISNGKGQLDGVAQYWVDGQLVIDRHTVVYRTAAFPNMKFNQFVMAPYLGDGSTVDQSMWYDDLVVMTERPSGTTPPPPPPAVVTSVGVTPSSATLTTAGATQQYSATARDAAGTSVAGQTFTWTSSNTAVATVTSSGSVRAVANGTATITASTAGISGTAGVTVSIAVSTPTASALSISTQPSATATSGSALAQQPGIQLRDGSGGAVSQSGVVVTASIATGGGTMGGTSTATTNSSGLASFTNLSITGSAGTRTLSFTASGLTGATSTGISVSASTGGGGTFATPNVVNNATFESGWDGFVNWSMAGTPSGVSRATDFAYDGQYSVKRSWSGGSGETGAQLVSQWSSTDHIWVRFYFRLSQPITSIMKFARFYAGSGTNFGGLFVESGNSIFSWGWDQENSSITTGIGLTQAQVVDGQWHSLEVDYWRNGDPSGYPSAAFWFDGNQVSLPNGTGGVTYAGSGNRSYWSNGRLYAGERASSEKTSWMEWLATLNAGNSTTGQVNVDKIAISTAGRIGP